jgi:hypothetical protein
MVVETLIPISALVSITALVINVLLTLKENKKKHMLENYTRQRFNELNKLRELISGILRETDMDLIEINDEINIKSIVEMCNELSFCFKPIYKIDCDTIYSLFELKKCVLEYHKDRNIKTDQQLRKAILEFRKQAYLYTQSAWTCIKKQISEGKTTEYKDFERIHNDFEKIYNTNYITLLHN